MVMRALLTLLAAVFLLRRPAPVLVSTAAVPPPPADRTPILRAQFTAGVRGSRAPPFATV
ncbi:hypothetical protein KOI35_42885 [Actinoplanes bogorensis]|uniref:Uncharacterized protein n=1 Tax=Paractinoplanes bogorensis TaxID=1610840 RepID=A0ABS5Z3J3_9ACTN|nr:hypothetical protein [Actinoplanes bogorensis]MBU2670269.1 hypothetical protein [Actinoplanes bogorensis]